VTASISTITVIDRLPEDERRALRALARRRRFRRRETIFLEGDPEDSLHIVVSGHVALHHGTPSDDRALLAVLATGDTFGEQALLAEEGRRTVSARAVGPAETLTIGREQFEELRWQLPDVDRLLVEVLAEQVQRLSAHLADALCVDVDTRVHRRLSALADSFAPAADGTVTLPFTRDEIASLAGATRPLATRTLKAAEEAGIVELHRGRVVVLDLDALAEKGQW
jgi:CRP/FNR family cyclic AMP-dependent transcriptional regulator